VKTGTGLAIIIFLHSEEAST